MYIDKIKKIKTKARNVIITEHEVRKELSIKFSCADSNACIIFTVMNGATMLLKKPGYPRRGNDGQLDYDYIKYN